MRTQLPLGLLSAAMSLLLTYGAYAAGSGQTLYRVINLGNPEGGTVSQGTSDSQEGWVVGFSDLAGNAVMQAELWRGGSAQASAPSAGRAAPSPGRTAIIMG